MVPRFWLILLLIGLHLVTFANTEARKDEDEGSPDEEDDEFAEKRRVIASRIVSRLASRLDRLFEPDDYLGGFKNNDRGDHFEGPKPARGLFSRLFAASDEETARHDEEEYVDEGVEPVEEEEEEEEAIESTTKRSSPETTKKPTTVQKSSSAESSKKKSNTSDSSPSESRTAKSSAPSGKREIKSSTGRQRSRAQNKAPKRPIQEPDDGNFTPFHPRPPFPAIELPPIFIPSADGDPRTRPAGVIVYHPVPGAGLHHNQQAQFGPSDEFQGNLAPKQQFQRSPQQGDERFVFNQGFQGPQGFRPDGFLNQQQQMFFNPRFPNGNGFGNENFGFEGPPRPFHNNQGFQEFNGHQQGPQQGQQHGPQQGPFLPNEHHSQSNGPNDQKQTPKPSAATSKPSTASTPKQKSTKAQPTSSGGKAPKNQQQQEHQQDQQQRHQQPPQPHLPKHIMHPALHEIHGAEFGPPPFPLPPFQQPPDNFSPFPFGPDHRGFEPNNQGFRNNFHQPGPQAVFAQEPLPFPTPQHLSTPMPSASTLSPSFAAPSFTTPRPFTPNFLSQPTHVPLVYTRDFISTPPPPQEMKPSGRVKESTPSQKDKRTENNKPEGFHPQNQQNNDFNHQQQQFDQQRFQQQQQLRDQQQQFHPHQQGFSPEPQGLRPQSQGFSPEPQGFRPQSQGFSPEPHRFQPNPQGFSPNPQGFSPNPQGFSPEPARFNPQNQNGPFGPQFGIPQDFNRFPNQNFDSPFPNRPPNFNSEPEQRKPQQQQRPKQTSSTPTSQTQRPKAATKAPSSTTSTKAKATSAKATSAKPTVTKSPSTTRPATKKPTTRPSTTAVTINQPGTFGHINHQQFQPTSHPPPHFSEFDDHPGFQSTFSPTPFPAFSSSFRPPSNFDDTFHSSPPGNFGPPSPFPLPPPFAPEPGRNIAHRDRLMSPTSPGPFEGRTVRSSFESSTTRPVSTKSTRSSTASTTPMPAKTIPTKSTTTSGSASVSAFSADVALQGDFGKRFRENRRLRPTLDRLSSQDDE